MSLKYVIYVYTRINMSQTAVVGHRVAPVGKDQGRTGRISEIGAECKVRENLGVRMRERQ